MSRSNELTGGGGSSGGSSSSGSDDTSDSESDSSTSTTSSTSSTGSSGSASRSSSTTTPTSGSGSSGSSDNRTTDGSGRSGAEPDRGDDSSGSSDFNRDDTSDSTTGSSDLDQATSGSSDGRSTFERDSPEVSDSSGGTGSRDQLVSGTDGESSGPSQDQFTSDGQDPPSRRRIDRNPPESASDEELRQSIRENVASDSRHSPDQYTVTDFERTDDGDLIPVVQLGGEPGDEVPDAFRDQLREDAASRNPEADFEDTAVVVDEDGTIGVGFSEQAVSRWQRSAAAEEFDSQFSEADIGSGNIRLTDDGARLDRSTQAEIASQRLTEQSDQVGPDSEFSRDDLQFEFEDGQLASVGISDEALADAQETGARVVEVGAQETESSTERQLTREQQWLDDASGGRVSSALDAFDSARDRITPGEDTPRDWDVADSITGSRSERIRDSFEDLSATITPGDETPTQRQSADAVVSGLVAPAAVTATAVRSGGSRAASAVGEASERVSPFPLVEQEQGDVVVDASSQSVRGSRVDDGVFQFEQVSRDEVSGAEAAAATAATRGITTPEARTTIGGAVVLGGIAAGNELNDRIGDETDPTQSRSELEAGEPRTEISEIGVGASTTTEIEVGDPDVNELEAGRSRADVSEVGVPESTGTEIGVLDTSAVATGSSVGGVTPGQLTDQDIPGGIGNPSDSPSIRDGFERSNFTWVRREFPTGGSAVVDESVSTGLGESIGEPEVDAGFELDQPTSTRGAEVSANARNLGGRRTAAGPATRSNANVDANVNTNVNVGVAVDAASQAFGEPTTQATPTRQSVTDSMATSQAQQFEFPNPNRLAQPNAFQTAQQTNFRTRQVRPPAFSFDAETASPQSSGPDPVDVQIDNPVATATEVLGFNETSRQFEDDFGGGFEWGGDATSGFDSFEGGNDGWDPDDWEDNRGGPGTLFGGL